MLFLVDYSCDFKMTMMSSEAVDCMRLQLMLFVWDSGELAGVSLPVLSSQFGDSTAQWLYGLARGCDTEEVPTITQQHHCTALPYMLLAKWAQK